MESLFFWFFPPGSKTALVLWVVGTSTKSTCMRCTRSSIAKEWRRQQKSKMKAARLAVALVVDIDKQASQLQLQLTASQTIYCSVWPSTAVIFKESGRKRRHFSAENSTSWVSKWALLLRFNSPLQNNALDIAEAIHFQFNTSTMPNWSLTGCCSDKEEWIFIVLYVVYSLLTMFTMEKAVAKPMKLIAIFIHEMGQ